MSGWKHRLSRPFETTNTLPSSYGMVLAKEKNEELAMYWLTRSVHLFPMNWGCWQEITALMSRVEDVSRRSAHILFKPGLL